MSVPTKLATDIVKKKKGLSGAMSMLEEERESRRLAAEAAAKQRVAKKEEMKKKNAEPPSTATVSTPSKVDLGKPGGESDWAVRKAKAEADRKAKYGF